MTKELKFYDPGFEEVVRCELHIADRPITEEDALKAHTLDCLDFFFDPRDYDALSAFKNLTQLSISMNTNKLDFLREFPLLEELTLEMLSSDGYVDFMHFSCLPHLEELIVSGGDLSDIDYKNLEGLIDLKKLESLLLHEFGTVDLRPLRRMPWLKNLYCGYANAVYDIDAIASLPDLEALTLVDVKMENLDFLDAFPDTLTLKLSWIQVKNGINYDKLSRFVAGDFNDIEDI